MATQIGDDAVKKATGRGWSEWLKLLDKAGAKKMTHQEIVAVVGEQFGVGRWWQQMVTVTYERERGLREVHQNAGGFSASISRTIAASVDEVFVAWNDAKRRKAWLDTTKLTIRTSSPNKSMRITWPDDTSVEVGFYPKGDAKSQLVVQHSKLPNADAVNERKAFWSAALARLKELLES